MVIPLAGMLNLVKAQILDFAATDDHERIENLFRDNRFVRLAELIAAGDIRVNHRHLKSIAQGMSSVEATAVLDRNTSWETAMRYGLVTGIATLLYWYAIDHVLTVLDLTSATFPVIPDQG